MTAQEYAENRRRRIKHLEAAILCVSSLAALEGSYGSATWASVARMLNDVINEDPSHHRTNHDRPGIR